MEEIKDASRAPSRTRPFELERQKRALTEVGVRRVKELEIAKLLDTELLELKDDLSEVRSKDLRFRRRDHLLEAFFRVQTVAESRSLVNEEEERYERVTRSA